MHQAILICLRFRGSGGIVGCRVEGGMREIHIAWYTAGGLQPDFGELFGCELGDGCTAVAEQVFRCLRESKSSFSIALMCTTRRRIPASLSRNQGPAKGDLIRVVHSGGGSVFCHALGRIGGTKSSVSIALICTTSCRLPASFNSN